MERQQKPPVGYRSPHLLAGMPQQAPVAVSLSGGADSVALLHILLQQSTPHVSAVHVHHGIRGEEADRDAAFCVALASSLGVPLEVIRLDVPAFAAREGLGLETAAREARYRAISKFLREKRIPLLVTAHHADDQLETLLQHLLRGSGLRGLCGIPACRPLDGATVVRPLLQVPKAQILSYCRENGLQYVTDSSNAEPCCPRNRLRAEVLPVLCELWPGGANRAAACAASLAEDEAYLRSLAEDFLAREGKSPSVLALGALPRPILVRVLQAMLPRPPEAVHIEALLSLIAGARPHASLSLPGATVVLENGCLCVQTGTAVAVPPYEVALAEGETSFPCGVAVLCARDGTPTLPDGAAFAYTARIDFCAGAVCGTPVLRPRRAGERIRSGKQHKLLRKLPCMAKFPPSVRAHMPLLCDEAGVLAVPDGPVRDGARRGADRTLYLFFN